MPTFFRSFVEGRLVVIRWLEPDLRGSAELVEIVRQVHAKHGDTVFLAAIIGPECTIPGIEGRRALAQAHDELREILASSRLVLLGPTIRQAMIRSVISGLGLLLGRLLEYQVDGSASELLAQIQTFSGQAPGVMGPKLRAAEVLLDGELQAK